MAVEQIKKFFSELRRRKVLRVAVVYGALGWILIEVASVVFPVLMLPPWTVRLVVALIVLGFPLTIALTWVFDITPTGIERTADLEDAEQHKQDLPTLDETIASVAVLPFDNLSSESGHSVLANGIATEIHSSLSKLHRVRVASRRSAFRLAESGEATEAIASALKVRYVLSGSLLRDDGRVRVIAELDDATEGSQIWSEKFERDVDDFLTIQAEIAESIVAAFGGERLRAEIERAQVQPTSNLDAWSLVQKARHYVLDYGQRSLEEAQSLLKKGIELDPDYAAAHAALGSVIAERVWNGFSDDPVTDQEHAIDAITRAEALAPRDSFVLKMSGMVWAVCGDPEQSIRSLRACVELAPFDLGAWGYLGWPLVARGTQADLEELHRVIDRLVKLTPDHPGVAYWLFHKSVAYACQDELEKSADYVRRAIDKHGELSWVWMHQANVFGLMGAIEDARSSAEKAARINSAMTPAHYESRLKTMGGSAKTIRKRLDGLALAGLLSV